MAAIDAGDPDPSWEVGGGRVSALIEGGKRTSGGRGGAGHHVLLGRICFIPSAPSPATCRLTLHLIIPAVSRATLVRLPGTCEHCCLQSPGNACPGPPLLGYPASREGASMNLGRKPDGYGRFIWADPHSGAEKTQVPSKRSRACRWEHQEFPSSVLPTPTPQPSGESVC